MRQESGKQGDGRTQGNGLRHRHGGRPGQGPGVGRRAQRDPVVRRTWAGRLQQLVLQRAPVGAGEIQCALEQDLVAPFALEGFL
jgi:hypothetical protein